MVREKFPIKEVRLNQKGYPKLLSKIADPPSQLYYRGNADLMATPCFAVVGSRKITSYGTQAINKILSEGIATRFTIVSGLALGVDAAAHQAALDMSADTIAVLGSGINDDCIFPRENFDLAINILESGGLIVSEYPANFEARPGTFPARNRIISGLSRGVLIVEADLKSGSLITARLAGEQGRDVFAVPGSIFSPRSKGPNWLLSTGAKPVTSGGDILEDYEEIFSGKKNISTKDPVENKIIAILDERGISFIDDIIRNSNEEPSKIIAAISMLELKGYIKELGQGKYILK
jgi:DNA processing protein